MLKQGISGFHHHGLLESMATPLVFGGRGGDFEPKNGKESIIMRAK